MAEREQGGEGRAAEEGRYDNREGAEGGTEKAGQKGQGKQKQVRKQA